jgi:hypothetical protein
LLALIWIVESSFEDGRGNGISSGDEAFADVALELEMAL